MSGTRWLAFGALITAIGALGLGEIRRTTDERRDAQEKDALRAEIADVKGQVSAALSAVITPEIIEATNRSVYLITDNGDPVAAAFVIDREKGILATAAHTAEALRLGQPEATIEIINQFSIDPIAVKSRKLHAGYGAFVSVVEAYQPIRKSSTLKKPRIVSIEDLPFDVALITVDPIDPATGQNRLGPDLVLASDETLLALKPGDPIAVIGFPDDRVLRDLTGADAASRAERGVVAAMIAPLDTAATARDPVINNLIIHRMATAGGNSGGPIINGAGEVVGVHSHGVKSTSSNADGVAQRADMIRDLLEDGHDKTRLFSIFVPAWRERLSEWARAEDVLPWSFYAQHSRARDRAKGLDQKSVEEIVGNQERPFEVTVRRVRLTNEAVTYEVLAPDAKKDTGFVVPDAGRFFEARFEIDPQKDAVIFAFDYDLNNRQGYCALDAYWREEGDDQMMIQRATGASQVVLRSKPEVANQRIVHAVFRRAPTCGYKSDGIMVGQLSWRENIETASLDETARSASGLSTALEGVSTLRTSVASFIECQTSHGAIFAGCTKGDTLDLSAPDAARFSIDPAENGVGLFTAQTE